MASAEGVNYDNSKLKRQVILFDNLLPILHPCSAIIDYIHIPSPKRSKKVLLQELPPK